MSDLKLNKEDALTFVNYLEEEPKINKNLLKAARRYKERQDEFKTKEVHQSKETESFFDDLEKTGNFGAPSSEDN